VSSKNIQDASTDDQSFKVQSFTTIQQVNTPQRGEIIYFYLYHETLRHSSVTMIKPTPLFKLIFYAAVFCYN